MTSTDSTEFHLPPALAVSLQGGRATIRVAGDVDLLTIGPLGDAIEALAAEGISQIDVDLCQAARIDSSVVEVLASAHDRISRRGGRLAVVRASEHAEALVRRRGLGALLRAESPLRAPAATAASPGS